jgi:hypothetical protein
MLGVLVKVFFLFLFWTVLTVSIFNGERRFGSKVCFPLQVKSEEESILVDPFEKNFSQSLDTIIKKRVEMCARHQILYVGTNCLKKIKKVNRVQRDKSYCFIKLYFL